MSDKAFQKKLKIQRAKAAQKLAEKQSRAAAIQAELKRKQG